MPKTEFELLREAIEDDGHTTVSALRKLVDAFVGERDWHVYHAPKNLAMALAIEAAELMEHFQWSSVDATRQITPDSERGAAVAEELADVVCYALALANAMGIDVSRTVAAKMAHNARKYPPGNPDPTGD